MAASSIGLVASISAITSRRWRSRIALSGFSSSVAWSTGAPSEMTISSFRALGAHQQAAGGPQQGFAVDVLLQDGAVEHAADGQLARGASARRRICR